MRDLINGGQKVRGKIISKLKNTKLIKDRMAFVCLFLTTFLISGFLAGTFLISEGIFASSEKDVHVNVQQVISIAVDANDLAFDLVPTPEGHFNKSTMLVKVYTNADGYKLYLTNKTSDTDLKSNVAGVTETISALTTLSNVENFPNNSWGYSLDGGLTYRGVSATTILLKDVNDIFVAEPENVETATSENTPSTLPPSQDPYENIITTAIDFGAKVDTSLPAGTY